MSQPSDFVMPNGRHKDKRITRVPISYLKWMVQEKHTYAKEAQAELDRRGTTTPELDISGHAIDRASLRLRKIWHLDAAPGEGLWSWMARRGFQAFQELKARHKDGFIGQQKIDYQAVTWIFELDGEWPVIKSVWPASEKE